MELDFHIDFVRIADISQLVSHMRVDSEILVWCRHPRMTAVVLCVCMCGFIKISFLVDNHVKWRFSVKQHGDTIFAVVNIFISLYIRYKPSLCYQGLIVV
jgi:hypothetical protein